MLNEQELREQIAKEIEEACGIATRPLCGLSSEYRCSCGYVVDLVRSVNNA